MGNTSVSILILFAPLGLPGEERSYHGNRNIESGRNLCQKNIELQSAMRESLKCTSFKTKRITK